MNFNTRVGWGECRLEGVDATLERMGIVFDTRVERELFLSSKGANRLCVGMILIHISQCCGGMNESSLLGWV